MSQSKQTKHTSSKVIDNERTAALRESPMMAHLLDALEAGTDIGHYGRLTFVMIARHFLTEDEIVDLLSHQPDHNADDTRALVRQVQAHDYNPPKRERILEWQSKQDFPICPTPDEPGTCNVYQELRFPEGIYDNINEFWEEKAKAEDDSEHPNS
jgi:DNA primase large subunit